MRFVPAALCPLGLVSLASAQCLADWLPATITPGTNGTVHAATMWDPDGAGPQRPRLVLGGTFTIFQTTTVANIVAIDPDTGLATPLGSGFNGPVYALTTLSTGELVAGGDFTDAGTTPVKSLARWNGSSWQALGGGVSGTPTGSVQALAPLPNGDLVVGGSFTQAGTTPVTHIASWDGTQWHALGAGMNGAVSAIAVAPNGDPIVGGQFTQAGGIAASRVARWDGTAWQALGSGVDNSVTALAIAANGDVIAGGWFTQAGGAPANRIARWNGTAWQALGSGCNATVNCVLAQPNGDLLVGGTFTQAGGTAGNRIARHAGGGTWQPLASGFDNGVRALTALPDGDVIAAGDFTASGTTLLPRLARWHTNTWQRLAGVAIPNGVIDSAKLPDGRIVAVTQFDVLRLDGTVWTLLGTAGSNLNCVATSSTGRIAIGGFGGIAVNTAGVWQNVPIAAQNIYGLAWTANGELVAATDSWTAPVQRWNGSVWTNLALPAATGEPARKVVVRNNGGIVVAWMRYFPPYPLRQISEFNGTSWVTQPVFDGGGGNYNFIDLQLLPNDHVAVIGSDMGLNSAVHRWDGSTMTAIGSFGISSFGMYSSNALAVLPNGDLVASSNYQATSRWNGSAWVPLGTQSGHGELAVLPSGEILALAASLAAPSARFVGTCFASAHPLTSTCLGPVGAMTLSATSSPWLGTTFASSANGFAPGALALSVFGFSGIDLPLATVLPQALPNCNLLAAPDTTKLVAQNAGIATDQLVIPNVGALRGTRLFHQFVQLELGGPSGIQSVSASNGLDLTLGGY